MTLTLKFRLTVTKYSNNESFLSSSKEFDNHPSATEIMDFVDEINIQYPPYTGFRTEAVVKEVYLIKR